MRSLQISLIALALAGCAQEDRAHTEVFRVPPGYPPEQWFSCDANWNNCTPVDPAHTEPDVDRSFSWDQQTLKANDSGCPTAVFIAPGGVLEQCE
jgi:hypothetical protein